MESRFQEESARVSSPSHFQFRLCSHEADSSPCPQLKSKMTEVAENLMKDSGLEHGIVHQVTHQPSIAFPAPHGTKKSVFPVPSFFVLNAHCSLSSSRPESNTEESRLNGEKINGEEPVGRSTFYNLHQEVNVAKDEHSSEEEERDEEDEDKEEEEPKGGYIHHGSVQLFLLDYWGMFYVNLPGNCFMGRALEV